jgi:glucosyl-dolichyl phosphate glucuronosyltransferase
MDLFVSVIVCTYNREKYLEESLQCLARQDLSEDLFEIILVNNRSTDRTEQICKHFSEENRQLNFRYFTENQAGLSYARNKGIKESEGNLVVFLDDDAMAGEQYLSTVRQFFLENKNVLAGGGRIVPEYETNAPGWMSRFLLPLVSALDMGESIKPFPGNKHPVGANMFFRKSFFAEKGVFKTDLGRRGDLLLGGEEKDIFSRIDRKKHPVIYLPGAEVRHIVPDKRLEGEHIDKLATGIGMSEAIRVGRSFKRRLAMCTRESVKWGGSIVLFLIYLMKFQPSKGKMLLRFRYFVTTGMLIGRNYDTRNTNIF